MESLSHNPAAAGVGAEVVANGTQGLSSGAAAAAPVTALPPAGADEVSAQAATAFAAEGAKTLAQIAAAQEELMRAGAALTEIAGIYSAVDGGAATTLT